MWCFNDLPSKPPSRGGDSRALRVAVLQHGNPLSAENVTQCLLHSCWQECDEAAKQHQRRRRQRPQQKQQDGAHSQYVPGVPNSRCGCHGGAHHMAWVEVGLLTAAEVAAGRLVLSHDRRRAGSHSTARDGASVAAGEAGRTIEEKEEVEVALQASEGQPVMTRLSGVLGVAPTLSPGLRVPERLRAQRGILSTPASTTAAAPLQEPPDPPWGTWQGVRA